MLTPRQRDALAFIGRYQEQHGGVSPTMSEICIGLGLSSKSGAVRLLDGLEERGALRRIPHRVRSIEILKPTTGGAYGELLAAAKRIADRDVDYIDSKVVIEMGSHGEALRAVRALRDAIAGAAS